MLHVLFRVHVSILQQQINWVSSVSCDVQAVNNSIIRRWLFLCILVEYLRFQNHMHLKIFRESAFQLKRYSGFIFCPKKTQCLKRSKTFVVLNAEIVHTSGWNLDIILIKHSDSYSWWKNFYHENCGLAKSKELIKINLMWTLLKVRNVSNSNALTGWIVNIFFNFIYINLLKHCQKNQQ